MDIKLNDTTRFAPQDIIAVFPTYVFDNKYIAIISPGRRTEPCHIFIDEETAKKIVKYFDENGGL